MIKCIAISVIILAQLVGDKSTGKSFALRWENPTTVVFRVKAPRNRLARIEVTENETHWREIDSIWTGDAGFQVPSEGGQHTAIVRYYPPTKSRGSTYQIHVMFPPTDTNIWRTIYKTNTFGKTPLQKWRMILQ